MIQIPGQVIDWITIEDTLKRREWHTPEVAQAIAKLRGDVVPEADQVMAYVEILKDSSLRDKMMKLSRVMSDYCMHKGQYKDQDFVDFSSRTIQTLIELQKQKVKKRISPVKETIREIKDLTDRTKGDGDKLRVLHFSVRQTGTSPPGIRKGFYYGLAGPRVEARRLCLGYRFRLAERNDFPVLFYTWEQTRRTLAARLLGRECYINPVKLLTEVSPEEKQRHALVSKVIERSASYSNNLFVIEAGRQDTIERIKAQAYNVMHEYRSNDIAIFFDYLQKIPLGRQYEDLRSQVNEASAQLADLSLELPGGGHLRNG
jgi:replicative DNA helicase